MNTLIDQRRALRLKNLGVITAGDQFQQLLAGVYIKQIFQQAIEPSCENKPSIHDSGSMVRNDAPSANQKLFGQA